MQYTWTILWYPYLAFQLLLALFLLQPLFLLLLHLAARLFGIRAPRTPFDKVTRQFQFGIIVTAHRETEFIPPIVDSLLRQTHPRFNVYVVADDCDTSLLTFSDPRIHILQPPAPLNDQMASLDFGFRHLAAGDEVLVVFDPDNLAHPDFLQILNAWYNSGCRAVCGNMRSKNKGGIYTRIDNWGATLVNFTDRHMRTFLGLSAAIPGCGVSVLKTLFATIRYDKRSRTGGFDKQLQLGLVQHVNRIVFARDALFYDEKIGDGHSFEQQRIRWLGCYFKFLRDGLRLLLTGIRRRSINLVYFAGNLIRPPYFILLLLSCAAMVADCFVARRLALAWLLALGLFSFSFLLIVVNETSEVTGIIPLMITHIPRIFYRQVRALFRLRLGKRSLLKTKHSEIIYIADILPGLTTGDTSHVTTGASAPPPAPSSTKQSPPPEYASSPPGPGEGKKPDYAHSLSSTPISPST